MQSVVPPPNWEQVQSNMCTNRIGDEENVPVRDTFFVAAFWQPCGSTENATSSSGSVTLLTVLTEIGQMMCVIIFPRSVPNGLLWLHESQATWNITYSPG
jgi:hypothetical protein